MSSSQPSSLERAVADAAGGDHRKLGFVPDAVQLSLLRGPDGKLDGRAVAQARGVGRPVGATNKRQKKIAQYIVAKYGDPIDALGNLMTMPLADLIAVMREAQGGESKTKPLRAIDALALQVNVTRTLLEYTHGKQPVAVNVTGKTDAVVIIPGINAPADVSMRELERAINQRGLEAIDYDRMQLIPPPEDAEFEPVGDEDDDDAEGDDA